MKEHAFESLSFVCNEAFDHLLHHLISLHLLLFAKNVLYRIILGIPSDAKSFSNASHIRYVYFSYSNVSVIPVI